jgi:prolyl 4-hydroxylase
MKRADIEGGSPHFIGCWNIERDSLCDELIEFFSRQSYRHDAGLAAGGINFAVKKSTDLTIHPRDLESPGYEPVKAYINNLYDCYKDYLDQFPFLGSIVPSVDIGSFNIQKYSPGGHFQQEHTERTSIVNSFRVLAWMTYLNDVQSGGSTTFTQQQLEIQPQKGQTLIWPAEWTHAHRGNIVSSGDKYIITGWMHFPHETR